MAEQKEQSPDACHDHANCWYCKQNDLKIKKLRGVAQEVKIEANVNVMLLRQNKKIEDEIVKTLKSINIFKLKLDEMNDKMLRIKRLNIIKWNESPDV